MNHHAEENPAVLALLSEDYLAVDTLIRTVRDLTARSSRRGEDPAYCEVAVTANSGGSISSFGPHALTSLP